MIAYFPYIATFDAPLPIQLISAVNVGARIVGPYARRVGGVRDDGVQFGVDEEVREIDIAGDLREHDRIELREIGCAVVRDGEPDRALASRLDVHALHGDHARPVRRHDDHIFETDVSGGFGDAVAGDDVPAAIKQDRATETVRFERAFDHADVAWRVATRVAPVGTQGADVRAIHSDSGEAPERGVRLGVQASSGTPRHDARRGRG